MGTMHRRMDKTKLNRKDYALRPEVRKQGAVARALKIRENIRREYTDKKAGNTYGSGSNDPSAKAKEDKASKAQRRKTTICEFCQKVGHKTKRSKHCTFTTAGGGKEKGKNRRLNVVV